MERRTINAYIRDLIDKMEGSKGGSRGSDRRFTGKQAKRQRWKAYQKARIDAKLPVVGSERLFIECWDEVTNVVEISAKGHSKCDECSRIDVLRDTISLRTDENGKAMMRDLEHREELHRREHRGERDYGDDMWQKAESCPRRLTMLNMDAPTTDQLQIPVQPRAYQRRRQGPRVSAWMG